MLPGNAFTYDEWKVLWKVKRSFSRFMGKINRANLKKTVYYLKRNGLKNTCYAVLERLDEKRNDPYTYIPPTEEVLESQRKAAGQFETTFSIVVPAYRTPKIYLKELITCVINQTYSRWELVLADATEDDSVEKVMSQYLHEKRIRYIRLDENVDISTNTNKALAYATGDYIGLLDHDDVLTENALYEMAAAIEKGKQGGVEIAMLYSDEDKCNSDRIRYYEPHRKEDFNLDLLLSNNYICHFLVMKAELMKDLQFRPEYSGAQDYDLVLRAAERLMHARERIVHIPLVLYHWRCHAASTAENPQSKQYAYEAGRRALQDFADRQGWKAVAEHLKHLGFYRLKYLNADSMKASDALADLKMLDLDAVMTVRADIGAVGGRLVNGIADKTVGGRMTETGQVYYQGLPAAYSGYMHRASLTQNAEVLDIRCIKLQKGLHVLFKEVTMVSYEEEQETGLFDITLLPKDADYVELSTKLSEAIRERGYQLLYLPDVIKKRK